MTQIFFSIAAMVISTALIFHLSVVAYQVVGPVVARVSTGSRAGGQTGAPTGAVAVPALFQNLGVAAALAGSTVRNSNLLIVGVLLIALAIVVKTRNSPELDRALEAPLLVAALCAFGCLGLAHAFA